jgi:hypothetical protein
MVKVAALPNCNFCAEKGITTYAKYDCKTVFGPWANVCQECFERYGIRLGLGFGQVLELEGE